MKKLLLLGGSHAEIPLICAARKMGYYVITTGNQVDGLGHPYGDEYINCDFSEKEAICALAKEQQVDAICSGCNDFAYLSAAYAAEKLGLPGHDPYETAIKIHHKDRYRALAKELGIKTPGACSCKSPEEIKAACETLHFPIIVKPVDLTGGKGMKRCDSKEDALKAYEEAMHITRESRIVAEEFIMGTNHGFSAYIQDKKVAFHFVDNEQYYLNPYLVSGASAPGDVPKSAVDRLVEDCEKLAKGLQLKDGILHIQFVLQEDGIPVIIEVCRRAPGDLYVHLVELLTGVDYPAYIVAGEAGISMPHPKCNTAKGYYVRHCIMANKQGRIKEVSISEKIAPFICEKMLWYRAGEAIEDVLKYKAGIVFLHFPEEKEYRHYLGQLTKLMTIEVS